MQALKEIDREPISPLRVACRHYTEPELINALYNKDEDAFAYLYDNYAANLNGIVKTMIKNKEMAKDLLQEIFIKIWNNFDKYDETKGKLYTWMLNLTRNLVIDTLRSKEYKMMTITLQGDKVADVNNKDCEFKKFDGLRMQQQLLSLHPEHLKLIGLAYYSGLTQAEIAIATGIPLGTVKTRMRTAIQHLRTLLGDKEILA